MLVTKITQNYTWPLSRLSHPSWVRDMVSPIELRWARGGRWQYCEQQEGVATLDQSRHHHCQVFIAGGVAAKISRQSFRISQVGISSSRKYWTNIFILFLAIQEPSGLMLMPICCLFFVCWQQRDAFVCSWSQQRWLGKARKEGDKKLLPHGHHLYSNFSPSPFE